MDMSQSQPVTHQGFTLLELLITLLVAAILVGIAAPSFTDSIKRNRVTTQQNELFGAIMLARSEAIKRSKSVSMCASTDGSTCSDTTNWHEGWLIYANDDGSGLFDNNEDELIRVQDAFSGGNTLDYGARAFLTFSGRGFAPGFNGTFHLCDSGREEAFAREIIISQTGRPRRSSGDTNTCPS